MSEFEKFEGTDAWFTRLKSLLTKDRPLPQIQRSETIIETTAIMDLSGDFKEMLEQHRSKKLNKENQNPNQTIEMKELKSINPSDHQSPHHATPTKQQKKFDNLQNLSKISLINNFSRSSYSAQYSLHNNSTLYMEPSMLSPTTDESFERMENMCNKSVSDPESTIYAYMKSIHENSKKSAEDEEGEALERLLNEYQIEEQQKLGGNSILDAGEKESQFKFIHDQTQLANIEPPSCIWEDTLTEDTISGGATTTTTIYKTSPVKMIGLLRPSTILEESVSSDTTNTSSFSYRTAAMKTNTSSEQYESANEFNKDNYINVEKENKEIVENINNEGLNKTVSDEGCCSIDNSSNNSKEYSLSRSQISSNTQQSEEGKNDTNSSGNMHNLKKWSSSYAGSEGEIRNNNAMNSISIDDSIQSTNSKPNNNLFPSKKYKFFDYDDKSMSTSSYKDSLTVSLHSKCTLNDISSFDDSLNADDRLRHNSKRWELESSDSLDTSIPKTDLIDFHAATPRIPKYSSVIKAPSSIIDISDNESDNEDSEQQQVDDTNLNEGFSIALKDDDSLLEDTTLSGVSHDFNDTIEEMEYIMKQGMKYMTEKGATPKLVQSAVLSSSSSSSLFKAKQLEDQQQNLQLSCKINSPRLYPTYNTYSGQKPKVGSIEKEKQLENFKRPMPFSRLPMPKGGGGGTLGKKTNFDHIISPVGAYIKNTPKTPLQSSAKPSKDFSKSKVVRELEFAHRDRNQQTVQNDENNGNAFNTYCSLPKKAYISSDVIKIVDERSPAVIPGGEKIHRFLQPSAIVIRHEGKMKLDGIASSLPSGEMREIPTAPKYSINGSLADLSIASGDVSLHTLRDAKKISKY